MPTYPGTPLPSAVSAPEIIDPMLKFDTDAGYAIRRARTSRPRRRWTLEYLGKTTLEMRQIRDFLQFVRLGTLEFDWLHPTASDAVTVQVTTPVRLVYAHGLFTGCWVGVNSSPNPSLNGQRFQVTRLDSITLSLNGTVAAGVTGTAQVFNYVPHAVAVLEQDTLPSPATLIGPEQLFDAPSGRRSGYYNFSVVIEELF